MLEYDVLPTCTIIPYCSVYQVENYQQIKGRFIFLLNINEKQ